MPNLPPFLPCYNRWIVRDTNHYIYIETPQRTTIYFRKIMGVKVRTIGQHALSGRAIAHDFLAYLSDMQEFAEALSVGQVSGAPVL